MEPAVFALVALFVTLVGCAVGLLVALLVSARIGRAFIVAGAAGGVTLAVWLVFVASVGPH
jgi:hypothetical protein